MCVCVLCVALICVRHLTHILFLAQLSTEQTAQLGAEMFIVKVSFSRLFCGVLSPAFGPRPKKGANVH